MARKPPPPGAAPHAAAADAVDAYWARTGLDVGDPAEARRLADLRALAARCLAARPVGARVLDVGCGDGTLLRSLSALDPPPALRVGIDRSHSGLLQLVRTPPAPGPAPRTARTAGVRGDTTALPFADASFDLVLCCDVLEHLPDEAAARTVAELGRVAARHVVLNVPFAEDLGWSMLTCSSCGLRYHRDHHLRRYLAADLLALGRAQLPGFVLRALRTSGGRVRRVVPLPLLVGAGLQLGHDLATVCPGCGERPAPLSAVRRAARGGFSWVHSAVTWGVRGLVTRDTELVGLWERAR
ncbi:MAG: class I SAM-dependent methyltransferase [Polyangia bacterium]